MKAIATRTLLALGVSAACAACTLFWPLDSHTLRDGDGDADGGGGVSDAETTDVVSDDAVATADAGDAADAATSTVVETFANVGTAPRLVATNGTHVFVVGADEKVIRIDKASRVVETVPTPTVGFNSQRLAMTALGADNQWIFLGGNEAAGCGSPGFAWKRNVVDAGTFGVVVNDCAAVPAIAHDLLDYAIAVNRPPNKVILHSLTGAGTRTLALGLPTITALSSTPDAVYVASGSTKQLVRVAKLDDAGVAIATTTGSPKDLIADGANVYWIEVEGRVASKSSDAGASDPDVTLATEPTGLTNLAADATRLYFTNLVEGTVRAVAKAGGSVETIASGQHEPVGIGVDASGVYWVNRADGTLMRAIVH